MSGFLQRVQRYTKGGLTLFFSPQLNASFSPMRGIIASFTQTFAQLFANAQLIPLSHKALNPTYVQDVRMGEVLSLAYMNAKNKDSRADQRIIFAAVISLLGLMTIVAFWTVMQVLFQISPAFATLDTLLKIGYTAAACSGASTGLFTSPCPNLDMGYQWIQVLLLGRPNSFITGQMASIGLRNGLNGMFTTYSWAMLTVAGFLVLYNLMSAVGNTAHQGTIGGKMMQTVWAPIRLVIAIGMLVPLGGYGGLNSGQLVVISMAEWGSGLASNIWLNFAKGYAANTGAMIITPPIPTVTPLLRDTLKILVCQQGVNKLMAGQGSITASRWTAIGGGSRGTQQTKTFDWRNTANTDTESGACGTIKMLNPQYKPAGSFSEFLGSIATINTTALVKSSLLNGQQTAIDNQIATGSMLYQLAGKIYDSADTANTGYVLKLTDLALFNLAILKYQIDIRAGILAAVAAIGLSNTQMIADAYTRGWVSAGIWFNTIARLNGLLTDTSQEAPTAQVKVASTKIAGSEDNANRIDIAVKSVDKSLISFIAMLSSLPTSISFAEPSYVESIQDFGSGTSFERTLNLMAKNFSNVLGTTTGSGSEITGSIPAGSSSFKLNTANPLAELSALGNRIILMVFKTVSVLEKCSSGGSMDDDEDQACASLQQDSSGTSSAFMSVLGGSVIAAGVTLAFVLPMIPFIRFMFGIMTWILSLFEAVIAIPVVALAHIRMDGEGLAGPMARSAYLLVLQLFLRPTLMIFGLIIALLIFNLIIIALNEFYSNAVRSAEGGGSMSAVAAIVYTVMYAALAYAFANASFKAIDLVPQQVLTWIGGQNVSGIDGTDSVRSTVSQASGVGSSVVSLTSSRSAAQIAQKQGPV